MITLLLALLLWAPTFTAAQTSVSTLDQFTSTSSPATAITQRTWGKAFRLTGQSTGCATFSLNGTLTSTGIACGSGSGGTSFSFPFTMAAHWGQTTAGTSTALRLLGTPFSLFASSTSAFDNSSTTFATVSNAWFPLVSIGGLAVDAQGKLYSAATTTFTAPLLYALGNVTCRAADGSNSGCLSSSDWNTFNGKQAAGNYITALTSDVTASGPGSAAATLATVNGNVGSFTSANITVNGKGLITAASNGVGGFSFPFTPETLSGQAGVSTSTLMRLLSGASTTAFSANSASIGQTASTSISSTGAIKTPAITIGGLSGLLQGNGASNVTAVTDSTTVGQVLRVTGSNTYGWGALNLGTAAAITGTLGSANIADVFLFNTGDVGTGIFDFGGATSFEIPNGSNPTVDEIGQIALDTTDNQLLIATSTNASFPAVFRTVTKLFSFRAASTSPPFYSGFSASKLIGLPTEIDGYTATSITCSVWGGTSIVVGLIDAAGNATGLATCAAATSTTALGGNNVLTASEGANVLTGTVTGAPDYLYVTINGSFTRE